MYKINPIKRYSCSLCHKTYSRRHDLERHRKSAHIQIGDISQDSNIDDRRNEDEMHTLKKLRLGKFQDDEYEKEEGELEDDDMETEDEEEEEDEEDDDESEDERSDMIHNRDPEDNQGYQEWYQQAMADTEEMRNDKYNKYISEGLSENEAQEKARVKVLWAVKHIFFDHYTVFLRQNVYLEEDDTHQEIISNIQKKIDNGMKVTKAVSRVLAKHKADFEGLFSNKDEDESEDESEEESEEN